MAHPEAEDVPSLRFEAVRAEAVPSEWNAAWDDLARDAAEPNPFYERWFLRPSFDQLAAGDDVRIIAVWRGLVLLGLTPIAPARRYGRLPVQHIQNWAHYHCFYGAPLIRAGFETAFWDGALALLDGADWAAGFLHLAGLDPSGAAFRSLTSVRRADIVHRSQRALLASDLTPQAYYETHVRKKKRKEIGRLRSRLDELGVVAFDRLAPGADPRPWIGDFLKLEASGWKGRENSALAAQPGTRTFFETCIAAAQQSGKLEMLRLTLDGKPIAMLVNFMTPPGSYSFKIAFDEAYARFSPGVLIQIENLKILDNNTIAWMDSCAAEDHPMINSLWAERREIVRVTVPLKGARRQALFHSARAIETAAAIVRGKR